MAALRNGVRVMTFELNHLSWSIIDTSKSGWAILILSWEKAFGKLQETILYASNNITKSRGVDISATMLMGPAIYWPCSYPSFKYGSHGNPLH